MKPFFDFLFKNKRHVATMALVFGFVVDLITFRSIDLSLSQIILSVHLVILAVSIYILSIPLGQGRVINFLHSWLPVLLQYSTGNLLSAFLILYSGSGSLIQSWPFFVLLSIAVIGNETLRLDTYLLPFRTTLFFLNLLLFSALSVPIFVHSINAWSFALSVAVATTFFLTYIYFGRFTLAHSFGQRFSRIRKSAFAILCIFVFLYFANLIPPIPLSLKDIGFYHNVYKTGDTYIGIDEKRPVLERFLSLSGVTLRVSEGGSAYVYTAVFAPADIGTSVVHRWQRYAPEFGEWQTENVVPFPIVGGRAGGYRGYSFTEDPEAGRWRVLVETKREQIIGRAYLTIERPTKSTLYSEHLLD